MEYNRTVLWEVPVSLTDDLIERLEDLHALLNAVEEIGNTHLTHEQKEELQGKSRKRKDAEIYLKKLAYDLIYAISLKVSQFKGKQLLLSLDVVEYPIIKK